MGNDQFEAYQSLRKQKEATARSALVDWFLAEEIEDLRVSQVKALSNMVVAMLNQATREAFELGQHNETKAPRP